MKLKNKIAVLVILGGVSLIGIYWFKKNKLNISLSQSKELEKLSDYYKSGVGGKKETEIYTSEQTTINGFGVDEVGSFFDKQGGVHGQIDFSKIKPKELEDMKKDLNDITNPSSEIMKATLKDLKKSGLI